MKTNAIQNNIPSGWQEKILGDVCDIINGSTPKRSVSEYWENGTIPWFTVDDIRSHGRIISATNQSITSRALKETSVRLIPEDSVLLCCTASIGEVAFTKIPLTTNQQFNGLVSKDKKTLFPYYLFYSAQKFGQNLKHKSGQTTINFLSAGSLKKEKILLPPIKEQQKIAEILSTVDEEIKKTDEIIAAIEKLKRGLMQQLFTRGIGHTKFKKTEIGEIPSEWKTEKLESIARVERGKFSHRPRNDPKFYGGNIPFIQTGDVVNSNGRIEKFSQTLNEEGLAISKKFLKGTIVLTIAANIGDTGILGFDSCFPDSLVGITANNSMDNVFLEYFLRTRKDYLNSIATQSAQKNINLQKLEPMLVIKPDIVEQYKIAKILSSVDEKISVNQKLKTKLTLLKKGLMQDLLSGEKRVN
jgi:type I restriction enzyme, S subunit